MVPEFNNTTAAAMRKPVQAPIAQHVSSYFPRYMAQICTGAVWGARPRFACCKIQAFGRARARCESTGTVDKGCSTKAGSIAGSCLLDSAKAFTAIHYLMLQSIGSHIFPVRTKRMHSLHPASVANRLAIQCVITLLSCQLSWRWERADQSMRRLVFSSAESSSYSICP